VIILSHGFLTKESSGRWTLGQSIALEELLKVLHHLGGGSRNARRSTSAVGQMLGKKVGMPLTPENRTPVLAVSHMRLQNINSNVSSLGE